MDFAGTVTAKLELVTKAFDDSLDEAGKKAWETGKKLTTAVSAPMAAAGAGIFRMAQAQGAWAEELGNLQAATGLSTTRLQELKYVSDMTGARFEGITNTSVLLQRKLMGIEEGSGPAAEAMTKLGVKIKDSHGQMRSMNNLLPEVFAALSKVKNPTQRNALAAQIFGRSMADVAPILAMSKAELDKMTAAAHASGKVMGEDTVSKLQTFDDQVGAVQLRIQGMATQALGAFLALPGPIQEVVLAFGGLVMAAGPLLQLSAVLKAMKVAQLGTVLAANLQKLAFLKAWAAALGPIAPVLIAIAAVGTAAYVVVRYWKPIKAFFVKLWDGVKTAFVAAWEFLKKLFLNYTPQGLLFKHWDQIKSYFANLWDAVYNATVGRLTKLFKWIWDQIKVVGRWFGFGAGASAAPAPKAASATAGGAGGRRGDSDGRVRAWDREIVMELKKINANTQKKAYA